MIYLLLVSAFQPVDLVQPLQAFPQGDLQERSGEESYPLCKKFSVYVL